MKYKLILWLILLMALAVSPVLAQEDSGPIQVGLRPDAPTYAIRGPYWVGTTEFVIGDEVRPIPLTMWYPALNPENMEESVAYTPIMTWTPMPEGDYEVMGHALLNATPNGADGPYPLVVLSQGYATFRSLYAYLAEHLASHGFMVAAPLHVELFYFDEDPWRDVPKSWMERPKDISKALDYAESLMENNEIFNGLIDMEQVAVVGHSSGGYTALASAGARWDLQSYNALCAGSADSPEFEALLCEAIVPNEDEMAQMAGFDVMPEGLWPSLGDPRVKAIVDFTGDAYVFGEAGLAEVTVPLLALGGSMDTMMPYDWGTRLAYDHVSSQQKSIVTFAGGEHFLFLTRCSNAPWLLDMDSFFLCSDPVWDMDRAHDLINHFSTAFLLDVLKGDTDAHAALLPENVSFPGITYETTLR